MAYSRASVPELENLLKYGKKKFVRYEEGAKLYSMGLHSFQELAKEAGAVYHVKRIVLVNTEVIDAYMENSYSYTDKEGKRHTVYETSLAELRKKERQIIRDIEDGIDAHVPEKITLNDLWDKYIGQKYDLKPTTRANYKYCYDRYVRDGFGKRKIVDIKYTDIKKFYYGIIQDKELSSATLDNIHKDLHPAFQMAVRDGLQKSNPSDGVMAEIKKSHVWNIPKKCALTVDQQRAFTGYIRDNKDYQGWTPVLMILLGTGMRIGECLGLRWDDLDFEKRTISVNHNLTDRPYEDGSCAKHIQTPKTRAGARTIPMIDEVFEAFLQEYDIQKCMGYKSETIDGYTNFVFLTTGGSVITAASVNRVMHQIIDSYNAKETKKAKEEMREPVLLPDFFVLANVREPSARQRCTQSFRQKRQ